MSQESNMSQVITLIWDIIPSQGIVIIQEITMDRRFQIALKLLLIPGISLTQEFA